MRFYSYVLALFVVALIGATVYAPSPPKAYAAASLIPAFATFSCGGVGSNCTGAKLNTGTTGTNTIQVAAGGGASIALSKLNGKPTVTFTAGAVQGAYSTATVTIVTDPTTSMQTDTANNTVTIGISPSYLNNINSSTAQAANSALAAAQSVQDAANSAISAAGSAANAQSSATAAGSSASSASTYAGQASASAGSAAASATAAATSAGNANNSAIAASGSASTAGDKAAAAASSATAAATSATNAGNYATAAAASASSASTAATNAGNSATASEASRVSAASTYDTQRVAATGILFTDPLNELSTYYTGSPNGPLTAGSTFSQVTNSSGNGSTAAISLTGDSIQVATRKAFPVTAGRTYRATMIARKTVNGGEIYGLLRPLTSEFSAIAYEGYFPYGAVLTAAQGWQTYTYTFTVPTGWSYVRPSAVANVGGGGTTEIAQLSIEDITESTSAGNYATAAASSASSASTYATNAGASASAASSSATSAATSSTSAGTYATNASNSASAAASSASSAGTYATNAADSASYAYTLATQASDSAALSASSASSSATYASTAQGYASTAQSAASSADAAANRYSAQYTIKVDANGKVAGIGLFTDNTTGSAVQILANKFVIVDPSNSATNITPFTVSGSNVTFGGTVSASNVTAGTLTGSTIQTAASGERFVVDIPSKAAHFYDSTGAQRVQIGTASLDDQLAWGIFGSLDAPQGRTGLYGAASNSAGVYGRATTGSGVVGQSTDGKGLVGLTVNGEGVWGHSSGVNGYSGVHGQSDYFVGVMGDGATYGGEFWGGSKGSIHIGPKSSAPTSPDEGSIYYDGSTHHFMGWNGTSWKQLDN